MLDLRSDLGKIKDDRMRPFLREREHVDLPLLHRACCRQSASRKRFDSSTSSALRSKYPGGRARHPRTSLLDFFFRFAGLATSFFARAEGRSFAGQASQTCADVNECTGR